MQPDHRPAAAYHSTPDEAYWTPRAPAAADVEIVHTQPAPDPDFEQYQHRGAFRKGPDPRRHRHVASTGKSNRTIYLLHFSTPFKHARHYLGSTANLQMRLNAHNNGGGARLTQVAREAGITFELVRTWPGNRREERRLKVMGGGARLCPVCRGIRQLSLKGLQ